MAASGSEPQLTGPDLQQGIAAAEVREGVPLLGHADGEAVILVRAGGQVHALGATCTHYGGPLAEGLVADGAIRCPWHHACFDLATGRAHGPALAPIACCDVALEGGTHPRRREARAVARRRRRRRARSGRDRRRRARRASRAPRRCAPRATRRDRDDRRPRARDPVDRPNLSKDYLAGNAPEEWVYLRTAEALAAIEVDARRPSRRPRSTRRRTPSRTASGRELP